MLLAGCMVTANAAIATKLGTGTDLNAAASWSGGSGPTYPTSADVATWTSTSLGAGLTLGGAASWGSINVLGSVSASIDITGAGVLTIGASGITIDSAAKDMSIANSITLGAAQTWNIGSGRTLTCTGVTTGSAANSCTKDGAGTLVKSNGGDNVSSTTITAGTLKGKAANSSGTVTINGGTWDLGGAQRQIGILTGTGGQVNNSGTGVNLIVGSGDKTGSYGGVIANGTGLVGFRKQGTGTTTLTGINTFAGNMALDSGSGPLVIGGAGQLGSGSYAGTITFSGGTFTYSSSASQTLSGTISGPGALIQNGPGTLTLSGAGNNYSGLTTVAGGTLVVSSAQTSQAGAILVNDSASLKVNVSGTSQLPPSALTLGSSTAGGTLEFNGITSKTTAPINVTGSGALTVNGSSSIKIDSLPLTVAVNDSYPLIAYAGSRAGAGTLTVTSLPAGVTAHLTTGSSPIALVVDTVSPTLWNAGTGDWDTTTANWTIGGSSTTYSDAQNVRFDDTPAGAGPFTVTITSPSVSPAFIAAANTKNFSIGGNPIAGTTTSLNKSGSGTLTLSGINSFGGGTTVSAGTLAVSGSGTLGASTGSLTVSGGTVGLGGTSQSVGTVTLSGGAIQNGTLTGTGYALQSGTVSAALAGGVVATKTTTGTVSLSGPNTYTGGTAINSGKLQVNAAENPGVSGPLGASGSISFGGGSLQYSSANTYDYSSRLNSSTPVVIDVNGQSVTFATAMGGTSTVTLEDSSGGGILTLSAANAYRGTIINAGTLRLSGAGKPGSVNYLMTINGGTFDLNGSPVTVSVGAFNGGAGAQVVNNGGSSVTFQVCNNNPAIPGSFAGVIADGSSAITFRTLHTSGVFTLSGANTYSGNTTVTAGGQLKLAHSLAIQNSTLASAEGIVFDSSVASHAFTFGGLVNSGNLALQDNAGSPNNVALTVGNNNVSSTYGGILSGGGSLTKIGTGRLILSGASTYAGATVVSNGTLFVSVTGSLLSATTIKSNATLGGSGSIAAAVTIETGATLAAGTFGVGKLTTGAVTLNSGATNLWEISSATGTAGTDWDLVDAGAHNVDVQSTSGSPFTFRLISVGLNNFNKDAAYSWPAIAGNVLNFAADKFTIDATGFTNDLAGGYFFPEAGSLKVAFTNNHPPIASPLSYAFAKGVAFKPFNIPIATFLANNTADADGDARTLVSLTSTNAFVSTNATDITISSDNGLAESIAYVVRDLRSSYRAGDTVRMATNYINIVRTNSVGTVAIANLGATNMTLSFYGIPNYQYVIQRSPDMSAWTDVVTNTATDHGLIEYTETPPYNPAFYRMRQE
jgi:fibronectin-binding autotransporter adhesin